MAPGAFAPRGHGLRSAQKVRLMHAAVRHLLTHDPSHPWDDTLGTPLNQEDLLGTLIVFTVVVVDALGRMGVDFRGEDAQKARDAYVHFWLVVGALLGIDYKELRRGDIELAPHEQPLDLEELRLIEITILRRQSEASIGGQTLMASLLAATSSRMPWFMKGFPEAATRSLLGRQYADALAVPPAGPARLIFEVVRMATRTLSPRGPGQGLALLAQISTKNLYQKWIDESQGAFPVWRLAAVPSWGLRHASGDGQPPSQNGGILDIRTPTEQKPGPVPNGSSTALVE